LFKSINIVNRDIPLSGDDDDDDYYNNQQQQQNCSADYDANKRSCISHNMA